MDPRRLDRILSVRIPWLPVAITTKLGLHDAGLGQQDVDGGERHDGLASPIEDDPVAVPPTARVVHGTPRRLS